MVQLQRELVASTTHELPSEELISEKWDNFLLKLHREVEIEGGRARVKDTRKQQQEEEATFADEFCGKRNVLIN